MLLHDEFALSLSDADVILVEEAIPKRYIRTVQLIRWPKLVMFNRPKEAEVIACDEGECCCSCCGIWHSNGSWVCLDCWEPITISGIHDRQTYLRREDRADELMTRYGITNNMFEELRNTVGSNIVGLNSNIFNLWTRERPPGATFPKFAPEPKRAKPSAPAPYHASKEGGERRAPVPAAAAPLVQGNEHVPDKEIRNGIRRSLTLGVHLPYGALPAGRCVPSTMPSTRPRPAPIWRVRSGSLSPAANLARLSILAKSFLKTKEKIKARLRARAGAGHKRHLVSKEKGAR